MIWVSVLNKKEVSDGRLLLNAVYGLGPVSLNRLFQKFGNDPWKILSAKKSELQQVKGIRDKVIDSIQKTLSSDWLTKERQKLHKIGARFIYGEELPKHLTELMDPPVGLYCLGEIPRIPCISIVGTRVPTLYGKKLARQLAYDLAKSGLCIVSGMARRIDTEAHLGALEGGGQTIAFMGSGLDVIYPPENLALYKRIQDAGAVLSEFPLARRADRRTFPMRNRLVAGVSLGVLVIESAKSGGSMITAKFAAEQGRTVFALPGRVDQPESEGCLELLRDGATLVRNTDDILEELTPMLDPAIFTSIPRSKKVSNHIPDLDENEQKIIQTLSGGDRLDNEQLHQATNISISEIIPVITMLEIRGLITKRPDGKYETNLSVSLKAG